MVELCNADTCTWSPQDSVRKGELGVTWVTVNRSPANRESPGLFPQQLQLLFTLAGLEDDRQESQQGPSDNGNAKRRKISSTPQPKVYAVWNNKVEHSECKISSSHQETQVMMT